MTWHRAPSVVRGERIVTPDGIRPASLHIAGDRIARIAHVDDVGSANPFAVVDAGSHIVLPGLVDTHVHINEPGRTEWEGFETATAAAAAGGATTVLDMPLNSIPATTSSAALAEKRRSAAGQCRVDVGFLGGVVPRNAGELPRLWSDGVFAFKCFLVPSGVDEFENVTSNDLEVAFPVLARLGATLMAHAELPGPILDAFEALRDRDPRRYATYQASRPPAAEVEAVTLLLELAARFGASLHIVHVAAAEVVPLLAGAIARGVRVTAETCPHYLAISAEEIADGATAFKCAPPIRDRRNRDALWTALQEDVVTMIVSDHSPCPPALKRGESGNFFEAWGGIASLELTLPVVWTEMRARGLDFANLPRWMCAMPARLVGLDGVKGTLAPGSQADFVVMDPDARFDVDPARLHQRHPVTPYAGRTLSGRVHATYLRGELIFGDGELVGPPAGRLLARGDR